MKLEIYNKQKPQEEEPVRLALSERNGVISVIVVAKNGDRKVRGNLVDFNTNGTIHCCISVNEDFGFQLDKQGRIKES